MFPVEAASLGAITTAQCTAFAMKRFNKSLPDPGFAGHHLRGFAADRLDLQWQIARGEPWIRGIDECFKRRRRPGQVAQQHVIDFAILFFPETTAFIQKPETGERF
jgi:hypothetical protein